MVIEARMSNQFLWGTKKANVLKEMLAMQAQEFPYAKWSLAQRTPGMTEAMVDKAFAQGSILRTHLMRPTWHFVSAEDIFWLVELTAPRVKAVNAPYHRANGLDDTTFKRANTLFEKALSNGEHLERKQMRAVLEAAGMELTNLQLGFILGQAELDRVICSGAPRGKQQTYALLELRAPGAKRLGKDLGRDEAIAELARRYFTTRGPATLKDFAWWSGLTQADGRRGAADAGIAGESIGGRTYYFTAMPKSKPKSPRFDLVQIYDEIGMAYTESRDHNLDPEFPRPDMSPYYHSILLDGRLIGQWRRNLKGKTISFETHLFRRLDGAETEALEAALQRFRDYASVA